MKRTNIKWLLCSVLLAIMFQSCWFIKQIPETARSLHYMLKQLRLEKKTIKEYSYGEKYKFILKNDGIYIPCIVYYCNLKTIGTVKEQRTALPRCLPGFQLGML